MARNVFDQSCRYLTRNDPWSMLSWLLGLPPDHFRFVEWLDTRAIPFPGETDQTGDMVARLENLNEGSQPWAIPLEFQIEPDPLMFGRLWIFTGQIWLQLKPDLERGSRYHIGAIVVNLTGKGNASRRMEWPEAGLRTDFIVKERNLASENADDVLTEIESGKSPRVLLPWIPLMQHGNESGILEKWKKLAESEPDSRRRSDYGALALIFAEATDCRPMWKEALKGWNMIQSQQVLEWMQMGREEGQAKSIRDNLHQVLQHRFGQVPNELRSKIERTNDIPMLQSWFALALQTESLENFLSQIGS